jgi:PAS domain S-box-containing protein
MKILIVDDIKENIYLLEAMLKGAGHDIVPAVDGAEALEKLRVEGFDMIVSDILMPAMDGFKLCQECKGDEKLKDIPFVFYTATYKDERDEELALKLGADKFLIKPIEPEEFIKIIQGVIRDVEEGKLKPQEPALRKTEETFELYSERLVKKLEKKMLDLEREITERERAEERVKHLNLVLSAIRKVNQLIVHEKDTDRLLQGVCDNLIENRGYYNAWIVLLDDTGRPLATAEAALGKDFSPIVKLLKSGKMTDCAKKVQMQQEIVITKDPFSTCTDCPLAKRYRGRGGYTAKLEHGGKIYGLLTVSIPGDFAADEEEQSLFEEVAGDIGYALHNIEMEEERKRAEEELEKHREHLEELVKERTAELTKANQHLRQQIEERKRAEEALRESENGLAEAQRIAHMGNWDLDLVKNELRWSDEIYRIFGLKPQEFGATYEAFLNTIHPDDREFVDTSYTKSVKSNTPYDIVHRIVRPDGEVRYVHEKAEDIKDETGKTIRSIGTVQDITERKKAEDALKKRTAELQSIVNSVADREVRMAELKEAIQKLRTQLEEAGQTPVADDPLKEMGKMKSER